MALEACYECEGQVSSLALFCPHCGAPTEKGKARDADLEARLADLAGTVRDQEPAAEKEPRPPQPLSSTLVRGFLVIGLLIAAPIYMTRGEDALLIYLAQFLLLGFGLSLVGFGMAKEPRTKQSQGIIIGGWMYTIMVASAIASANLSHIL